CGRKSAAAENISSIKIRLPCLAVIHCLLLSISILLLSPSCAPPGKFRPQFHMTQRRTDHVVLNCGYFPISFCRCRIHIRNSIAFQMEKMKKYRKKSQKESIKSPDSAHKDQKEFQQAEGSCKYFIGN